MTRSVFGVVAWLLCFVSSPVAAQGNLPWEEYDRLVDRGREIAPLDVGSMFGDQVDMYTGALSFSATDVSIPGNNALPVAITRKLSIYDRRHYGGGVRGPFADWAIDIPNVSGVFAPNWHDNRCEVSVPPGVGSVGSIPADEYWSGNIAELPGGGEMLRANVARPMPSAGGPYLWVTEGNTYFSCLSVIKNGTGQGFLAIDTNGNKYWLDHMAQYPEPAYKAAGREVQPRSVSRMKNILYATRVEDRFGNSVTYSYSNSFNQPVRPIKISSSDGRTLTLQYNSNGYVSAVSDGSRTWSYTYTNNSLTRVTLPDGSQWNINLAPLSSAIIQTLGDPNDWRECFTPASYRFVDHTGSITHPSGATATFVVGPRTLGRSNVPGICRGYQSPGTPENDTRDDFPVYPIEWTSLVAKSKLVQGVGVEPMQWTYTTGGHVSWQYPAGQSEPLCRTTTCGEPLCTSDSCAGTRATTIQGPGGRWEQYVFGNSYRYNEGKLLSHSIGTGPEDLHKVVLHTYNYATSGQPYPAKIGTSPQARGAGFVAEYTRPLVKTETLQDGAAFVWQVEKGCDGSGVYCFDSLARPLKISRASTVATALTGDNPVLPPSKAPTLLAPATNSTGSYAVTWTSVASASTYQLRERLDGGAWETAYNGDALTTTVSGRGEGDWDYQARACNSAGCSVWSAVETTKVRLPPQGAPVLTVPEASSTGTYTVSWTGIAATTHYELQERIAGGAWSSFPTSAAVSRALSGKASATYDYRVRACNGVGCAAWSAVDTIKVTLPPTGVPTLTVPPTNSNGGFTASWTSVAAATRYELQERKDSGAWQGMHNSAPTSKTLSGKTSGTYEYRVRACNDGGCAAWSATGKTVVTLPPTGVPTLTVPETNSSGSYSVSWTSVAAATRYELDERVGTGAWRRIHDTAPTTKALSGQATATYEYRVRACNVGGCAGWSEAEKTTVTRPPTGVPTLIVPSTNSTGAYTASWTSVAAATRYELQERKDSGSWARIHNTSPTSKSLSGKASGTYEYRVRACNDGGCAGWSSTGTTRVTLPPTGIPTLTVPQNNTTGSYTASWTSVAAATRYELQQRKDGGTWSLLHNTSPTSKALSGQASGTYDYQVRACNDGGCAAWSAIKKTVVLLPPTGIPTLTVPETSYTGSYTTSWTAVAAATRYELELRIGTGAWNKIHDNAARSKAVSGQSAASHYYRVRACNPSGCAAWSAIKITVVTLPPASPPTLTVPASNATGSYRISWTSVAASTRYEVQENANGAGWALVHYDLGNHRDLIVGAGGRYDYRARACNIAGCSAYSPVATTVVTLVSLGTPTLTVPSQARRGALFQVRWTAVSGATHYVVEYSINGIVFTGYSGTGLSYQAEHYDAGIYYYRVKACNGNGCGSYSPQKAVSVSGGSVIQMDPSGELEAQGGEG